MFKGGYTAIVTPMNEDGSVDYDGLDSLLDFQIANGIQGIIAVGTTGESPTLLWEEHNEVIERTCGKTRDRCIAVAGTGSNSTRETLEATAHAAHAGAEAVLLVDPYYNGPSSVEIRREYVEPVASGFPQLQVIPYIIPGRTGTMMHAEDLAILARQYENVSAVKEATGDFDNMARTRRLCGEGFDILSGDDDKTVEMMKREDIGAAGVISVMSNVVPGGVQRMTELLGAGDHAGADRLAADMQPFFGMVGVAVDEKTEHGTVQCKFRNPLPVKTLMNLLGMPAGPCRRPLGKLTRAGLDVVVAAARQVHENDPGLLAPVGEFFGVDVGARLQDSSLHESLIYSSY